MLLNALELPLQFHLSLREIDPSFQYHQKRELTLSELDCASSAKKWIVRIKGKNYRHLSKQQNIDRWL